jgi:transcriptional regulator with XRE-family HTH domain
MESQGSGDFRYEAEKWRLSRGLTHRDLAERMGFPLRPRGESKTGNYPSYSRMLAGKSVSLQYLNRLAAALDLELVISFREKFEPKKETPQYDEKASNG